MNSENRPVSSSRWVSIRAQATSMFTLLCLALFVALFFSFHAIGENFIRDNAPKLLGPLATPDLVQQLVDQLHQQLTNAMIPLFAVSYLIILVLILLAGYRLSRPLAALTAYAERVAAGDYSVSPRMHSPLFSDEVTLLDEALTSMVEKVQGREQKLRQQVVALQIVIDGQRQAQQVEEITENEFFSSLKARAQELRQGSNSSRPAAASATESADPPPVVLP